MLLLLTCMQTLTHYLAAADSKDLSMTVISEILTPSPPEKSFNIFTYLSGKYTIKNNSKLMIYRYCKGRMSLKIWTYHQD